ncbi:hypothetical protein J4Q44_G00201430 [Coregonus suidteri]|uniref:Uncharacterized protein n=1 Tax=Coregonus suidteri TaxID=861788 RepID=A0AAN8LL74_9TELE
MTHDCLCGEHRKYRANSKLGYLRNAIQWPIISFDIHNGRSGGTISQALTVKEETELPAAVTKLPASEPEATKANNAPGGSSERGSGEGEPKERSMKEETLLE